MSRICFALDSESANSALTIPPSPLFSISTAWSVFSVIFVFLYFYSHPRSLFAVFLAVIGITIVLFSSS